MKQAHAVVLISLGAASLLTMGVVSRNSHSRTLAIEHKALPVVVSAGHPSKEETYTITSVLKVRQPVDPKAMKDDFQDVRVLAQDKDSATLEVTYYPLHHQTVVEDPNWHKDDAPMTVFLQPTPAENWDAAMRDDLIKQLKSDGIDPERLTDKQLVEQVSHWAMSRAHTTNHFAIWDIYYPDGKPTVFPVLRAAFNRQKPTPAWTDQQMFEQEALGKAMFYGKVHGSCTSSSIYLTTIFRALGIPTRTVFCIPPFDPNDDAQAAKFYAGVHDNAVRETVRAALSGMDGFANHLFNEVYIGKHWVRLNYDTLGQPILDAHYFGLLTHIYTSADLSRAPLAQTWGVRYAKVAPKQPKLSSVNPYMLLSVHDHFGNKSHIDNPPVPIAELQTATITALLPKTSSILPKWVADDKARNTSLDFFLVYKEWVPGSYQQMRVFRSRAGHQFLLTAPGQPNIRVRLNDTMDSSGDGSFQAFGAQIVPEDKAKLDPGVTYTLLPKNISTTYRWAVAPGAEVSDLHSL